jgi:hypothetical protein
MEIATQFLERPARSRHYTNWTTSEPLHISVVNFSLKRLPTRSPEWCEVNCLKLATHAFISAFRYSNTQCYLWDYNAARTKRKLDAWQPFEIRRFLLWKAQPEYKMCLADRERTCMFGWRVEGSCLAAAYWEESFGWLEVWGSSLLLIERVWPKAKKKGGRETVAYPWFFFGGGGVKKIQVWSEGRESGDLGAAAP